MSFESSPFVLSDGSTRWDPSFDYLGETNEDGHLHFNLHSNFSGLICSQKSQEADTIASRLINSYVESGSSCLMPRYSGKDPHNYEPFRTQRLGFSEEDITLRHVLELCTPPDYYENRGRILNSVQYVLSQLTEPFNLQKFIELVDGEKWDDSGATFIALRQTLLTSLISGETSISDQEITPGQITLIDMTDNILSSTGLDTILMDMVLSLFLKAHRERRALIVFSSADGYLQSRTMLSRSIASMAQLGESYRPNMIVTTANLPLVPLDLFNTFDYVLNGSIRSPEWKRLIQEQYGLAGSSGTSRQLGKISILSPESSQNMESNDEAAEQHRKVDQWNDKVVHINIKCFQLESSSTNRATYGKEFLASIDDEGSEDLVGRQLQTTTGATSTAPEGQRLSWGRARQRQPHLPLRNYVAVDHIGLNPRADSPGASDTVLVPFAPTETNVAYSSQQVATNQSNEIPQVVTNNDDGANEQSRLVDIMLKLGNGHPNKSLKLKSIRKMMNSMVGVTLTKAVVRQIVEKAIKAGIVEQESTGFYRLVKTDPPPPTRVFRLVTMVPSPAPSLPSLPPPTSYVDTETPIVNPPDIGGSSSHRGNIPAPASPSSSADDSFGEDGTEHHIYPPLDVAGTAHAEPQAPYMDAQWGPAYNYTQQTSYHPLASIQGSGVGLRNLRWDLPPVYFRQQHVSADAYPQRFSSLVETVLRFTGSMSNVSIAFDQVRKAMGTKENIKPLGFKNFNKMTNLAWEENVLRFGLFESKKVLFLINTPASLLSPSDQIAMKQISRPSVFLPIVTVLTSITNGVPGREVPVGEVKGRLKAQFGPGGFSFVPINFFAGLAIRSGVINEGSKKKVKLPHDWQRIKREYLV